MAEKPRRRIAGEKSAADQAQQSTPTPARKKPLKRPARPAAPHKPGLVEETAAPVSAPVGEDAASDTPSVLEVVEEPGPRKDDTSAAPEVDADRGPRKDDPPTEYQRSRWLAPAILGAAVLLLGGLAVTGWAWNTQRGLDGRESRQAEAETAAISATEGLFAFSNATGAEFTGAVEALVTDRVRDHEVFRGYADSVAQRIDTEQYVGVTSPITAAATECGRSCSDDEVEVLVAFTYVGQSPVVGFDAPVEYQLLLTMVRSDGTWLIDEIVHLNETGPLGPSDPEGGEPEPGVEEPEPDETP